MSYPGAGAMGPAVDAGAPPAAAPPPAVQALPPGPWGTSPRAAAGEEAAGARSLRGLPLPSGCTGGSVTPGAEDGKAWYVLKADGWLAQSAPRAPVGAPAEPTTGSAAAELGRSLSEATAESAGNAAMAATAAAVLALSRPSSPPPAPLPGAPEAGATGGTGGGALLSESLFRMVDRNNDGVITRAEFEEALGARPLTPTKPPARAHAAPSPPLSDAASPHAAWPLAPAPPLSARPASAAPARGGVVARRAAAFYAAAEGDARMQQQSPLCDTPSVSRCASRDGSPFAARFCPGDLAESALLESREVHMGSAAETLASLDRLGSQTTSMQMPTCAVEDAPPAIAKLLEAILAQQVEGLGECLNICAQRSRTLKLLGFQHLHYDARLQTLLQTKAQGVCRPMLDLILTMRALFGWREAARSAGSWRCLGAGRRRHGARAKGQTERLAAVQRRAVAQLHRTLASEAEALASMAFGGWAREAVRRRLGDAAAKLELASAAQFAMREKVAQKAVAALSTDAHQKRDLAFKFWAAIASESKRRSLKVKHTMAMIADSALQALEECFRSWHHLLQQGAAVRQAELARREKLAQEASRRRRMQVQVVARSQATSAQTGMDLFVCFNSWRRARDTIRAKERLMAALGAANSVLLTSALQGWAQGVSEQKAERSRNEASEREAQEQAERDKEQRLSAAARWIASSANAAMGGILSAWRGFAMSNRIERKRKHQLSLSTLRRIEDNNAAMVVQVFTCWKRESDFKRSSFAMSLQKSVNVNQFHIKELEEKLELAAEEASARMEAKKTNNMRLMTRHISLRNEEQTRVAFKQWFEIAASAKVTAAKKKEAQDKCIRSIWANAEALKASSFRGWVEAVSAARLLKSLEEERKRAEELANSLAQLKAEEAARAEEHRNERLSRAARSFSQDSKVLLSTYLGAWQHQFRFAKDARAKKEQNLSRIHRAIASDCALVLLTALASWKQVVAQAKCESEVASHRERMQRDFEEERRLREDCDMQRTATGQANRQRLLKAFRKQHHAQDLAELRDSFSAWSGASRDSKAVARQRARKQEETRARALKAIKAMDSQFLGLAFRAWVSFAATEKGQLLIDQVKSKLEHAERQLQSAAEASQQQGLALEKARARRVAALGKFATKADKAVKRTSFLSWQQELVKKQSKARSCLVSDQEHARGQGVLLAMHFRAWACQVLVARAERDRTQTGASLTEAQAAAQEQLTRQRSKAKATLLSMAKRAVADSASACFLAWRVQVREARADRHKKLTTASWMARSVVSQGLAYQAECWHAWAAQMRSGLVAKQLSSGHQAARLVLLKRSRVAAEKSASRLHALLMAQTVAEWRLIVCLGAQASEHMFRHIRGMTRNRSYIIKLRNLLLQYRLLHAWCSAIPCRPPSIFPPSGAIKVAELMDGEPHEGRFCCGRPCFPGCGAVWGASASKPGGFRPCAGRGAPALSMLQLHDIDAAHAQAQWRASCVEPSACARAPAPAADAAAELPAPRRPASPVLLSLQVREAEPGRRSPSPVGLAFSGGASPQEMAEAAATAAAAAAAAAVRLDVASGEELGVAARYDLATQAALNDCSYKELLEHNRREIRDRWAGRPSSAQRGAPDGRQWGVWAAV